MSEVAIIDTSVDITPQELKVLATKIIEAFPNGITLDSITDSVIDCMIMVGQINKLSGLDKKQLVIDMLIYIVKNTDSGVLEIMDPIIINAVPHMIDSLIEVEKGKLRFNPKILKTFKLFPCCS